MLEIVTGSIFDSKEKYIVHQTNCITTRSAGIAKEIFDRYSYANLYSNRIKPDTPGTIIVRGNGLDQRYVIGLMGQYYPGKPKYPDAELDGIIARKKYFHKALMAIARIPDLESVAFNWRIGCKLAGGDWEYNLGTITNFAKYVDEKFGTKVVIYRPDGEE